MAMLSFGGIDVSKDRLDVVVLPEEECSSVPNDAAGWAELVERLRGLRERLQGRSLRHESWSPCLAGIGTSNVLTNACAGAVFVVVKAESPLLR